MCFGDIFRKRYCLFFMLVVLLIGMAPITAFASAADVAHGALLRFPDIADDWVVFVAGEDIWKAPVDGGVAVRLTMDDGKERYPKFSPDGSLIAFTGEYDGNEDVYVMDTFGGNITRLTYHPGGDLVIGWHPTRNKIMFRSARHSGNYYYKLFLISPDGTGLEELPMHQAVQGSFSPDGTQLAYNQQDRERRTWKRYVGGRAQDVYVFDLKTLDTEKITAFKGTDRIPMWIGSKIYFSSDRTSKLNVWAYDTKTSEVTQMTQHEKWDIRRPSCGDKSIVYEHGGNIWRLDTETGITQRIPIELRMDHPETRPYLKSVADLISTVDCSPNGKSALITARGEVFSASANSGEIQNLTNSSGARDKYAVWSPNGKQIAWISDADGENNIYLCDAKSRNKIRKITDFKDGYRHSLRWSPDSKKLAFTDQTLTCYILDITSRKLTAVDKAEFENIDVSLERKPISDFSWSPDSRYLTYAKMTADQVYQVFVFSLETGEKKGVSNGLFNDFNPIFSRDGTHLLFISNRRFDPTFCDFEWEMVYKKVAGIYAITLKKDGRSLYPLKTDTEQPVENSAPEKKSAKMVKIDFDGITDRVEQLPLPRGNYRDIAVNDNVLFFRNLDEGDFNRFEFRLPSKMNLVSLELGEKKTTLIQKGVTSFRLSGDGKTIVFRSGKKVGLLAAKATAKDADMLDLSNLKMWLTPKDEWRQLFNEAWRMERDYYYEPDMHGVDWPAMKEKYLLLINVATCRQDVRFIVGELIGELNTSHTYAYKGESKRISEKVNVGMLGVDWQIDKKAKKYRFGRILNVPGWTRNIMPPLYGPGIPVNQGDYLLAVNGAPVTTDKNIYSYFQNLANRQVTLLVNSKPESAGATEVTVKTARSERTLRYLDWAEQNRLAVDRASNGQIGYLHLPDTFLGSAREFPKYFYSQTRKKGLIVDGRFNGGGLDPSIFLQRLNRPVVSFWTRRQSHDQMSPSIGVRAHMVCLTNHRAGSGGDELPHEFRQLKMGPVIGTRSWGGLVGVSMFIDLIDGGMMTAPDYRVYSSEGEWVVENEGVTPDIIVEMDSKKMQGGYDTQLMKGVEVLLEKINTDPRPWPTHPEYPQN